MAVRIEPANQLAFRRTSWVSENNDETPPANRCSFSSFLILGPLTRLVSENLSVRNQQTDAHVAFKVKTTAPKQYCVRPNSGKIKPGETVQVQGNGPFLFVTDLFGKTCQRSKRPLHCSQTSKFFLFSTVAALKGRPRQRLQVQGQVPCPIRSHPTRTHVSQFIGPGKSRNPGEPVYHFFSRALTPVITLFGKSIRC